ncbi:protein transport protein Sec31A-like [Ctenocephalides felis]|uniref:protein transport protein Sec31A-like n=1 Tax=Ctenocephalides felis TaxID=7515 RepID=UPI000E6E41C8|nr:protein transport protein Sec31A-like [Ctenocephalides felis]
MKLKESQKTANIAWSPATVHPIYLATGTAAQQLDSSFSTSCSLEILGLNAKNNNKEFESIVSVQSEDRFYKLVWGNHGDRKGAIVGGCEAGKIKVYDAEKLINGEEGLIAKQEKHTGAVRALDLNPFQTNLLSSGASESEIYIWDLNQTDTPMSPGTKTQPSEDIVSLAWNRQVQHILASSFPSRCVVWDLRKNEPIIKLTDSQSHLRWSCVCWHPEIATQLALSSEDDQNPVVQIWDLRFATSPLKVFQKHSRGVLSLAWSQQDPSILLSSGKDNKLCIWDANSEVPGGELLSEQCLSTQWNFAVSLSPRDPSLFAVSSFDGAISAHTLMGGSFVQEVQSTKNIADSFPGMDNFQQQQAANQFNSVNNTVVQHSSDPLKPPKWLKKKAGAKFGFGGKLISYTSERPKTVDVSQMVTEPELVTRSQDLERCVQNNTFLEYCLEKADRTQDQNDRYLWYFLKARFAPDTRGELLDLLGYKTDDVTQKLRQHVQLSQTNQVDNLTDQMANLSQGVDGSAAFDAIAAAGQKEIIKDLNTPPSIPVKINTGEDVEGLITLAILSGNIEAAVELCLDCGRMADAIIISITGGSELLARTQHRYLESQAKTKSALSHLISGLVTEDWSRIVSESDLDSWREVLAVILKNCNEEDAFKEYCETLAHRLTSAQRFQEAALCHACAGDADALAKRVTSGGSGDACDVNALMDAVELVTVMRASAAMRGQHLELSPSTSTLLTRYAMELSTQGSLETALSHLGQKSTVPAEQTELDELRDRLYCALGLTDPYRKNMQVQQTSQNSMYQQQMRQPSYSQVNSNQTPMFNTGLPGQIPVSSMMQPPKPMMPPTNPIMASSNPLMSLPAMPQTNPMIPTQSSILSPSSMANPLSQPSILQPASTLMQPPPSTGMMPQQQQQQQFGQPPSNVFQPPSIGSTMFQSPNLPQAPQPVQPPPMQPPPRPVSVGSSHGSVSGSSRSKYILDPSVQSGVTNPYGSVYNNTSYNSPMPSNSMYNSPVNANTVTMSTMSGQFQQPASLLNPISSQPQPTNALLNPMLNSPQGAGFVNQFQPQAPPPTQMPSRANPTPPPGWNDPPVLNSTRRSSAKHIHADHQATTAPITHPLFGQQPPQQQPMMLNSQQNQQMPMLNPQQHQQQQQQQFMNPQQQHAQFNTGLPNAPPAMMNQNQQFNQNYNNGYVDNLNNQMQQKVATPPAPEPVEKFPIPEEHIYLQVVLDELRNKCAQHANNPQLKRKLEDVSKKLEALYDMLRENRLSDHTLQVLHQMVQMIQIGDYAGGLGLHTALVSGPDFAQIANFMPGLKVLLLSASQLQVVLR